MPTINIRWTDNTAELKKNLAEGLDQIEASTAAVGKLVQSLRGDNIIAAAHKYAAAMDEIGDAGKLTASAQERVNGIMTKAVAQLDLAGQGGSAVAQRFRELAEATKQVEPPTSRVNTLFQGLGQQILSTAAGFVSAQAIIGAVSQGFGTLTGFLRDSVTAYSEAEAAQKKLTTALRSQGTATPETIAQFNQLGAQFQSTTIYSDDLINTMQALLVQVGGVMPSAMDGALKASTDLASGLGIDLQTATTLVAKAAAGHTETLGKYGITVSDAALQTRGFDAVLEAINKQFGGQAAAQIDTYAGRVEKLKNAWNNVQEALGKAIVDQPILAFAIAKLTEKSDDLAESNGKVWFSWKAWIETLASLQPGIGSTVEWLFNEKEAADAVATAWLNLRDATKLVKPPASINPAPLVLPGGGQVNATLPDPTKLQYALQDMKAKITALTDAQRQAALDGFQQGLSVDQVTTRLKLYWPEITRSAAALDILKASFDKNKAAGEAFNKSYQNITALMSGTSWDWTIDGALKLGASVEDVARVFGESQGVVQKHKQALDTWAAVAKVAADEQPLKGMIAELPNIPVTSDAIIQLALAIDQVQTSAERKGLPYFMDGLEKLGQQAKYTADDIAQSIAESGFIGPLESSIDQTVYSTGAKIKKGMSEILTGFPQLLVSSLTGGGGAMGAVKAVGSQIGSLLGDNIGKAVVALGKFGGPIGAAIGSLLGPAIGALAGVLEGEPEWQKVASDIGRDMGVRISDQTAKGIEANEQVIRAALRQAGSLKGMFSGGVDVRPSAELLSLQSIINDAGGLNTGNLDTFTAKLRDTFVLIGTAQLSVALGTKILDANWQAFVTSATDGDGRISAGLKDIINLNAIYGTQSKEIAAWQKAQAASAADGFSAVVSASDEAISQWDDIKSAIDKAKASMEQASSASLTGAIAAMGKEEREALKAGMADFAGTAEQFLAQQADLYQSAPEGDSRLKTWLSGQTLTAVEAGNTFLSAIKNMGTAERDALSAGMEGFSGTATQFLAQQAALYQYAQEGDARLKTWLSGQTLATIGADKAAQDYVTALAAQQRAAEAAKQELSDLSIQAVASYAASIASGVSVADTLAKVGPSILKIKQGYDDLGISIDDAAFSAIAMQAGIASKSPTLISGVAGLNQEMIALDNLGLMNADTFGAMQRTGMQMYVRLQSQVAALGGDTKDALLPMQDYLQQAAAEAALLGIPLDANTQMLIGQSKELGIWKEKSKSGFDLVTDAVTTLVKSVTDLINQLRGIPTNVSSTVTVGVDDPQGALDLGKGWKIPKPKVVVDGGAAAEGAATGAMVTRRGLVPIPQYFGLGGFVSFVPRGSDTIPAMLTPNELVSTEGQTGRIGRTLQVGLALADAVKAIGLGGGGAVSNTYVTNLTVIAREDSRIDPDALFDVITEGMRTNRGYIRTAVENISRQTPPTGGAG